MRTRHIVGTERERGGAADAAPIHCIVSSPRDPLSCDLLVKARSSLNLNIDFRKAYDLRQSLKLDSARFIQSRSLPAFVSQGLTILGGTILKNCEVSR